MHGAGELDCAHECELYGGLKSEFHTLHQVVHVDEDVDKYIQHLDRRHIDGNETAVAVMDHEISSKSDSSQVIHTTSTVGHLQETPTSK